MRNSRPVTVRVDGKRWRRVPTLSTSRPTDQHFLVEIKRNGSTTLRFGDGVHGASPSKASKMELTFGTGAGAIRIGLRRSRATHSITTDQALWSAIRNRTRAIDF